MFAFVFVLLAVFFTAINASTHSYTSSLSINGAMGYMRVQFDALQNAVYTVDLDMTDFKTTCDMTQGLTYHIHSFWTDTETNSVTTCSNTGGHYDPYLACSGSSQDHADKCTKIGRTADQGYTYACNPDVYKLGHWSSCEVGDLSGKFGRLMPQNGTLVFTAEHVDRFGPQEVNYEVTDNTSNMWASVVIHCPADSSRLMCASFRHDQCKDSKC